MKKILFKINCILGAFVNAMKDYGVLELVQTGIVALERGEEALDVQESRYEWPKSEE